MLLVPLVVLYSPHLGDFIILLYGLSCDSVAAQNRFVATATTTSTASIVTILLPPPQNDLVSLPNDDKRSNPVDDADDKRSSPFRGTKSYLAIF